MDDVTANHLKKANSVRTNLLLVTYANCRQISMARKSFKINSRSLEELSSLYESQEIIINNPIEIGKPNTSEGQEMILNSSRHSSNKSLTHVMLSPMNEELYTDTKTLIAFLDRKKIVFSAQKLKIKQNSSNETSNISKSVIEGEIKSTCCTSIKEQCAFESGKIINKSCKFLRKLAKTYKNYLMGNHSCHKSNIDSNQMFSVSNNQSSGKKPIPKRPSKHAKNQSCALVSKYVDISTIDEIEEIHPPRKSFCVDSKISFLSTNDIREILKAPKQKKYQSKQNFNVNNSSMSSFSPQKKKKKNFKKLFSLNIPNIKNKIYQIFGKSDKKENNDTLELKRGNFSENFDFISRGRNKAKTYQKEIYNLFL